jgi:CRISPR-associated protein Cmr3
MNTILLQPTDVLFFRDGRPMTGSHAGHTAAWPLPDITNHAFHAALHRAGLADVHAHDHIKRGNNRTAPAARKFGCLLTAGPYPVRVGENGAHEWFFPRPKDATLAGTVEVALFPANNGNSWNNAHRWSGSSLPAPLIYAIASARPPSKESAGEPWMNGPAFEAYLKGSSTHYKSAFARDDDIADQEANLGIAIDPATGTTGRGAAAGKIYTAHYLRLREQWRMGVLAEAMDRLESDPHQRRDLISALFPNRSNRILVGGQQRVCTATVLPNNDEQLPLPVGLMNPGDFRNLSNGKYAVKWVLLSPAIWPEMPAGVSQRGTVRQHHPGGWLPNWICPHSGSVLLRVVPEEERKRRRSLNYAGKGYDGTENSQPIHARLVAALVPKPLVVTGWALPSGDDPQDNGGAKSTHLAVAPGAVYYFEADTPADAEALARALNWHGKTHGTEIKNRRSTLLGEKGYGLGVCGTWQHQQPTSGNVPDTATHPQTQ